MWTNERKWIARLHKTGAWFLPQHSSDLNPIELTFAKLKAHLRKAAVRTYGALWKAIGDVCEIVEPLECWNYFKQAGYASD